MLKAKAFGLASLLFCGSIGGLAGEKQTDPADFAPFTVEVTRGGPIGVCPLTNPPMDKGVKFIIKPKEGEGYFMKGKGKILSSKSHGQNVWVAVEDSATGFVAALKSLGTDKSTLVLCGGEWDNSGNGGNGKKDDKSPMNWLAKLVGEGQTIVFLCHQYPGNSIANNFIRKGAYREAERYGDLNNNYYIVEIGDGKQVNNINQIDYALSKLVKKENVVTELYSIGHGVKGALEVGYTNTNELKRVVNADSDKGLPPSSCLSQTYTKQFEKYLMKEQAIIYLNHCFSGSPVSKKSMVTSIARALSNKYIVVGLTGSAGAGNSGLSPLDKQSTYIVSTPNNN